jgi:sporulation protein YlmC with PRC-barrel domain
MRKISILLSTLVLAAMVLAACGGGATSTNVAGSPPPVTVDATEEMTATESPTEVGSTTETPGVPVTGDINPARLSNQLDFTVWSQDGEQIGDVNDMVLDLDNSRVAYVVVGTGGFLDLGEREILVPWESLQLQTGSGDTTGGQQNAFILQTELDTFRNAPDFDLTANLPDTGQAAGDWDLDVRNYWQGGGTGAGTDQATATAGTGTDLATATPGTGTDLATATPGTGTDLATATPGTGTDQGLGNMDVTIDDMIIDTDNGDILYMVVNALMDEGERWIPVPLSLVQWNAGTGAFVLDTNPAALHDAPSFQDGQFPDTTTSGWNSEFDTYWQNNGGTGGTGTGTGSGDTAATATPTP